MESIHEGNQFYVEENFEEASEKYSNAIRKMIGNDQWPALYGRALCRIKKGDSKGALEDLSKCISIKPDHHLTNYYLAVHLMKVAPDNVESLEKAHQFLLKIVKSLKNPDERFKTQLDKCVNMIEKSRSKITVSPPKKTENELRNQNTAKLEQSQSQSQSQLKPQIQDAWYQNPTTIFFTIYVKNLTEKDVAITFRPRELVCKLKFPDNTEFTRSVHLMHEIIPEKCTWEMNPFKVNISLIKKNPGDWLNLEEKLDDGSKSSIKQPWITRHDWKNLSKEAEKELEQDKPEGEAALQQLFQKIYADGDDDQRKAMIKSFQTSNGTVLSTNWKDVADKDYEGKDQVLPTGQNVKKWDY